MASASEVEPKFLHGVVHSVHGLTQENWEDEKENLAQKALQNAIIDSRTQWYSKDQDNASGKNQARFLSKSRIALLLASFFKVGVHFSI